MIAPWRAPTHPISPRTTRRAGSPRPPGPSPGWATGARAGHRHPAHRRRHRRRPGARPRATAPSAGTGGRPLLRRTRAPWWLGAADPAGAGLARSCRWRAGAAASAATLIDCLILLVSAIVLTVIVVAIATGSDTAAIVTGILGFLAFLVVAFIYAPALMMREGQHNGQTWGKQIIGIRVVRDNGAGDELRLGRPPGDRGQGATGLRLASSILPIIPWFLDYFWPLWDDENRALHDIVCPPPHVLRT